MLDKIYSSIYFLYRNESLFFKIYIYFRLKLFYRPFKKIEELTIKEGRILDLGCGFGQLANYLALKNEKRKVVGIDQDYKRISAAKRSINGRSNIVFLHKNVNEIEEEKLDFKVIVVTDFLHHLNFQEQERLLKKISHSLEKGGQLIIMEVMERPKWKYFLSYLADLVLYPFKPKHYYHQSFEMKKILEDFGFTVEVIPYHQRSIFASVIYQARKE